MEAEGHPLAEELIRLLASAANASRLYPPSSALPAQAIEKFAARSNEITAAMGPLRFSVDPRVLRLGEAEIAVGQNQPTILAEALHAMQVGQLIVAPGLDASETQSFIHVVNSDPVSVRQRGVRSMLVGAGVTHIAVIEVSLRASEEAGLLGLDLTNAPLEDIGHETVAAAERWSESAEEGAGQDDMRQSIDRLEEAARDIAATRVAEAMLRLDEATRARVLALSLRADASGSRMSGMFGVIARMKPAALARLLTIVAASAGTDAARVAGALDLPPEIARQVALLLIPPVRHEAECGVPADPAVEDMAAQIDAEEDESDLRRQVATASPSLAAGKALATTVQLSRISPTVESIRAIGEALPRAARDGAFASAREALRRLDEMMTIPALSLAVEEARNTLQDPEILADVCAAPQTDADAAIAGEILKAAGSAGADAMLTFYLTANSSTRSLFGPVIRGMGESLLNAASRVARTGDSSAAIGVMRLLPMLPDKRAIPVIVQGLEHLDADVRRAAVRALADVPGGEGNPSLASAVSHWDPQTRRFAVREIGRVKALDGLTPLIRTLEDINFLERNHELKKEVIKSLEALGSPKARKVLRRWAGRRFVFGRKNKELRFLARRALEQLPASDTDS